MGFGEQETAARPKTAARIPRQNDMPSPNLARVRGMLGPMAEPLYRQLARARCYDLAHVYQPGMPHHPSHPPFAYCPHKLHGDYRRGGVSSASEVFVLGGHVGTHIDALCHFSQGGLLHGGVAAAQVQSFAGGVRHLSIDTVGPIFRRGVLLDVAAHERQDVLPLDFAIGPDALAAVAAAQPVDIRPGDVVLIRTGWARFWTDPAAYIAEVRGPGIDEAAARWLSARGIFAAGSDTIAFECVPSDMPVHVHFLVEKGIHIIEALDLERLAADGVYEFTFVAIPLKIAGGTGSPIRALALVDEAGAV